MKRIKGLTLLILSSIPFALFGCGGGGATDRFAADQSVTRNETLSGSNTQLSSGSYGIIYRFIASSAGTAKIAMTSESLKCRMWLTQPPSVFKINAPLLSLQSTSSATGNAEISFDVVGGGFYYLVATTDTPRATGSFKLIYPTSLTLDGFENQISN